MNTLLGVSWGCWFAAAFGSALGGVLRYAAQLLSGRPAVTGWPWGTFLVNLLGCLAIGLVAGWWFGRGQPPLGRALLMVGVLGGFTTYSSFALETVHLWNAGAATRALAYVLATTLTCVLAAAAGLWLWQQINSIGAAR